MDLKTAFKEFGIFFFLPLGFLPLSLPHFCLTLSGSNLFSYFYFF